MPHVRSSFAGRFGGFLFALAFLVLFLIVTMPAWAQDGTSTVVDFGPIVAQVIAFLVPTILTVASMLSLWVLTRLGKWLGLNVDARHRATVEQGLERAIGFALEKTGDRARGGIPIDMRHEAIGIAVSYAQDRIPDALAHFKVTPTSLESMVEARLEGLVVDREAEAAVDQQLSVGRIGRLRAGIVPA